MGRDEGRVITVDNTTEYIHAAGKGRVPLVNEISGVGSGFLVVLCADEDADSVCAPEDCNDNDATIYPDAPEICDGKDNDCDEEIDEGLSIDNDGDEHYVPGSCLSPADDCNDNDNTVYPGASELCDGKDNDCNPATADGSLEAWLGDPCDGPDSDLCKEGLWSCTGGQQDCSDNTGNDIEICDDADNDCDGEVDEELFLSTTCGVGECEGNQGYKTCISGAYLNDTCDPYEGAEPEECDTLDNNCNGFSDEGLDQGTICGVGQCAGNTGTKGCIAGSWVDTCDPLAGATEEVCDGVDNNCDGDTDEGVLITYYRDADEDGWGNGSDICGQACDPPSGCIDNRYDCDDTQTGEYCNTPPDPDSVSVCYPGPECDPDGTNAEVSVTLPNSTGGNTSIVPTTCVLDVPVGYTLNLSDACYEIETTAGFDGTVEVCMTFDPDSLAPPGISAVRMLRCDLGGGNCEALDAEPYGCQDGMCTLCATTDHFSVFTLVTEPDGDFDGWGDSRDNCPDDFNPSQTDDDEDGVGNACDNCPDIYDPTNLCQLCEGDFNGDADVDGSDLSLVITNPSQVDLGAFAANFGRNDCPTPDTNRTQGP
jgi:hypothetical protein